jgi:hypothetical protein
MNKKFFVAALSLLTLISIGSLRANAQSSCPNQEAFGVHTSLIADKNIQSQIEVTYFTTNDPNAFISEQAGLHRSASYVNLDAKQFVAQLKKLEGAGLARIKKQQSANTFLGDMAELNLERNAVNGDARTVNANWTSSNPSYLYGLDRETEVSVYKDAMSGDFYHLSLVSWFVNATANGGGSKTADLDADILLKPGQTAVFKLVSNNEVKRSGSVRSYVAITMRSVNNGSVASLARR